MSKHFNVAVDSDGIALVTMDSPGRSMNVFGPEVEAELADVLNRVVTDAAIKGVVVTSGKSSFINGVLGAQHGTVPRSLARAGVDSGELARQARQALAG